MRLNWKETHGRNELDNIFFKSPNVWQIDMMAVAGCIDGPTSENKDLEKNL